MLKSGAEKFVPLSTFLNLSGAPASPDVGLCTADADIRVWNVLPPVQNAGEFVRMWRHLMIILIKRMVTLNCDFTDFYRMLHYSAQRGLAIACRLSVHPSICLSVTLVDHDHIGWKSWKLTARAISPMSSLFIAQRSSTYSQGKMKKSVETRWGGKKWCAGAQKWQYLWNALR